MMCGGTGASQPANEEIQNMVDEVSSYYVFNDNQRSRNQIFLA